MHLNELAIRVIASLLIERRLRRSCANDRIRALSEDRADPSGCHDDCVGREGTDLHGPQIHRANSSTDALRVEDGGEKFPGLVFRYFAFGLIASHLLIESVKKLLTGCRSGECSSLMKSSTEA